MSKSKSVYRGMRMPRRLGFGHVTVINQGLMWASLRRAKIGFWLTFVLVGIYTKVIAATLTGQTRSWLIGVTVGLAAGSVVFVLAFAWPAIRLTWHWLPELAAAGAVLWTYSTLAAVTTVPAAIAVVLLATCGPLTYPPARRRLTALAWCAITRHRLRVCFAEFIRTGTADGRLPLILLARPTPAGERIWVWLRPGLSQDDLEGRYQQIAVATWATEVRAVASTRWAALVQVDITRRNTLADIVESPLPATLPADTGPALRPVPAVAFTPTGLDLPDIPDPRRHEPRRHEPTGPRPASRRPSPTPPPTDPTATPVDDHHDWI